MDCTGLSSHSAILASSGTGRADWGRTWVMLSGLLSRFTWDWLDMMKMGRQQTCLNIQRGLYVTPQSWREAWTYRPTYWSIFKLDMLALNPVDGSIDQAKVPLKPLARTGIESQIRVIIIYLSSSKVKLSYRVCQTLDLEQSLRVIGKADERPECQGT